MTRCVIYAAKSTADERGSITSQLECCRLHAEQQGWTHDPADEFRDEAASAYRGSRGPGLISARARAAELVTSGSDVVLLVFSSDRLARGDGRSSAHLVEYVLEATKAGYRIESVTEDIGGEMGLVLASLYGMRAHADSKAKGEHVRRGRRSAAERGRRNGGPRPYGYRHVPCIIGGKPTSQVEIVAGEAAVILRMYRRYAEGVSQSTIARELNDDGIRTAQGAKWSQPHVSQILSNPIYRGMVRNGSDLFPGEHESIVSDELWHTVESMRAAATRHKGRGGGRPPAGSHLLTGGLLRCSCGAAMRARTNQKANGPWEAYLCSGRQSGETRCTVAAIARAEVDTAVWRYFETVALDIEAMRREFAERRSLERTEITARIAEAEREFAKAAERIERVKRGYADGDLRADELRDFLQELEPERNAARAALERLETRAVELEREAEAAVAAAETEAFEALVEIRRTLAGLVTGSADLPAARQALRRIFDSFTLHRYGDAAPAILDADLAAADWYIVPNVRAEAVLSPEAFGYDADGEPTVLNELQVRKTTIPSGGKLKASER